MANLQIIQNALISINEAVFQDLCDCFIYRTIYNISFSRTGSQEGKQKTVKGTPDSFILLENGKYIFHEFSTNKTKGVSKLISDINKCLDTNKTNIPIDRIEKIILCFNFNLKPLETEKIFDAFQNTGIELLLFSLDKISLELFLNHRDLVYEFLKLPIDTGQIVSIDRFIEEYNANSQSIATPLDNPFLHRENEQEELKDKLYKENLIILNGAPGVGKTKLAIETIRYFTKENNSYKAYCISYKNASLINDLNLYLNPNNDYILFVDDANRIDNIGQIIGFYKQSRKGKFKIIITVRDYAYNSIKKVLCDLSYVTCSIDPFSDEQIIEIVKNKPFNILNSRYHKEINRIANGNPRLAIMVALLAIEKQDLYVLRNVSDLFDNYFLTFIKDESEFEKKVNIKILGLTAFFYILPYKDTEKIIPILESFGIDYNIFIEQIDILERLELLDIKYDCIKISEQNISTYFFYRAFIKKELLSFETLLNSYFEKNISRFKDCIISANNNFGYDNVIKKVKPILNKYLETIEKDETKVYRFLSMFWFYLQDETLNFIYNIVENLPKKNNAVYRVDYETNDFAFKQNKVIELIGCLFKCQSKLKDTIELSFEYVRREPQHLPELIHKIREELTFKYEDERFMFKRQWMLFDILIEGVKNTDELYSKVFFELSKTFLMFTFEQTETERNNTITIYHYPIPYNKSIKEFRKMIWEYVNANFSQDAFTLLDSYSQQSLDVNKEIMEYDFAFIYQIIEQHLSPDSFIHCKYVQEQIRRCKKCKVILPYFDKLSKKYTNQTYELYLRINWYIYRDKEWYEFDNHDEYKKLKETEIRKHFLFKNFEEIEKFYHDFLSVFDLDGSDSNLDCYMTSLDSIVGSTFNNSFEFGLYLLKLIINNNPLEYIPHDVFKEQLTSEKNANCLWTTIQEIANRDHKSKWEMAFYHYIPNTLSLKKYIQPVKNTISEWNSRNYLYLKSLEKFFDEDINLLEELLYIINRKITNGDKVYIYPSCFNSICLKLIDTNTNLIIDTYTLLLSNKPDFDCDKQILLKILIRRPQFLIEYIKSFYINDPRKTRLNNHTDLSIVWQIKETETLLKEILVMLDADYSYYGYSGHFFNSFFRNLSGEEKNRASKFILDYCEKNYKDHHKINIIVDVVKNALSDLYNQVLLLFISLTQDKDLFSKIDWCIDESIYHGDVIIGDIKAAKWDKILSIVNQSNIGYKLIPIKQYINQQIDNYLKFAEKERRGNIISKP